MVHMIWTVPGTFRYMADQSLPDKYLTPPLPYSGSKEQFTKRVKILVVDDVGLKSPWSCEPF